MTNDLCSNAPRAGIAESSTSGLIFSYGVFHGGFVQLIAGCFEMAKGNTFAACAFMSYGVLCGYTSTTTAIFFFTCVSVMILHFSCLGLRFPACRHTDARSHACVCSVFFVYLWHTMKSYVTLGAVSALTERVYDHDVCHLLTFPICCTYAIQAVSGWAYRYLT